MMAQKSQAPVYLKTYREGLLEEKIVKAQRLLESCSVCPRDCKINRIEGERGFCRAGFLPKVSSSSPHFGEEQPLVGFHGSGTIFFTHCNLGCLYCQNYSISHLDEGEEKSIEQLSRMMVAMQSLGCHNINFVSPTHYVPQILAALPNAITLGLSVPLVYNTGGYDAVETLKLLDGVFDIYMPDFKYSTDEVAEEYSHARDYPLVAKKAIKEMFRQVGDLVLDDKGIALRGLLIRHLVLPSGLAGTQDVMRFLSQDISKNTYVNIMAQYYPCGDVPPGSPLYRRISKLEYLKAVEIAKKEGITRLD
jgi:putative pyruvate formate lyase activating enzyme